VTMTTLANGFAFLEGPRWHDGALFVSDMHDEAVFRIALDGTRTKVADIPHRPSGLGWLPDGSMLIVSMMDKKLLRRGTDGSLIEHADLSQLVPRRINDMVVAPDGTAYVGNFGFLFDEGEKPTPTVLVRVTSQGQARAVADGLMFPNGCVITPDDKTLIVAETYGAKLTAFDIAANGDLSGRRNWAELGDGAVPDGICLDAAGAIWVASPTTNEVVRLVEGGEVTDRIKTDQPAIACTLGGLDGHTLFVLSAPSTDREVCREKRCARIDTLKVNIPAP